MNIHEPATIPIHERLFVLRAFQHKNFRLFFAGQTISLIGIWSQALAISWLVWRLTGSAMWLGISGFAIQMPMFVFGLPGGAAADRFDRLSMFRLMQVLCLVQAALLSALTIAGLVELWHVIALGAFLGSVYAFEFPLRYAFITDMVGRRHLLNAVSLNAATIHGTRIAGPMVAGFLVAWRDEGICFLINAVTFLPLIIFLFMIDRNSLIHVRAEPQPLVRSITEGIRHAWHEPRSRSALMLTGIVALFGFPYVYIMPIFAEEVFGGSSIYLGWLMGASAVGALTGALWLAKRKTAERLLTVASLSVVLFSASLIVFSRISTIWFALPVLAMAGLFITINFSGINTLLQHGAPDHLRGRIMSLFTTMFMGFAPFGTLIVGFLARAVGAQTTVTLCGASCLVAGSLVWLHARTMDGKKYRLEPVGSGEGQTP